MAHLFEPLTLRGVTIPNRIGVSPMCQYSAQDGFADDWHLVHLGARAVGGAGLIITEAAAVEARGRISPYDLGFWDDAHVEPLTRITQFIKEQGAVCGIQLAHAGRKAGTAQPWKGGKPLGDAEGGWEPIAPSALPFSDRHRTPHVMTIDDIANVQRSFRDAAIRAVEAGFDLIELHGAHGYLIHSFYSPVANQRQDQYGGGFENRTRFLIETVQQVRAVVPDDKVLAVRLSTTDWLEDGWTVDDSVVLASLLKDEGADLIDCSSGGISPEVRIPVGAGYQVPLAERVRNGAGIATATVGMITQAMQADALIRNDRSDLVLLGREMLRNPHWPIQAAIQLAQTDTARIPAQYERGY